MKIAPLTTKRSPRSAFTLVELLVVIVIIVTLASFGMIAANTARSKADAMKAKKVATDLSMAIENFQTEHNGIVPLDSFSSSDKDEKVRTDNRNNLMRILINKETTDRSDRVNQSGKTYFTAEEVSARVNGMYLKDGEVCLYDPWRNPYYIIMDTDGDEEILDPSDHMNKRTVRKRVIVFSMGPDGEMGTVEKNEDNVYSFR